MKIHRPRIKREMKFEYTDKTKGSKRHFKPVADEAVVSFDPADGAERPVPWTAETTRPPRWWRSTAGSP